MTNASVPVPEPPSPTLSSLCAEMAGTCLTLVEVPHALENEETVHALRVATKRLRAAWQLVKGLADSETIRIRKAALRDLSAHLSHSRDATVLESAARELGSGHSDAAVADAFSDLAELIRSNRVESPIQPCPIEIVSSIRSRLKDEQNAWQSIAWSDRHRARKAIRLQLRRSSDKVRRRTREAQKSEEPDTWHEWRKAVKRLRYQREFVAQSSGRCPGKIDARISRIGSNLGARNDLANLLDAAVQFGDAGKLEPEALIRIRKEIAGAERHLLSNCRRLGRRLLSNRR